MEEDPKKLTEQSLGDLSQRDKDFIEWFKRQYKEHLDWLKNIDDKPE